MQIKHRYTNEVLFENDSDNMQDCLAAAIEGSTNLSGANLRGANLGCTNFGYANLGGVNLGGVNLSDANLGGAYLGGSNLHGANFRGAYLSGANLSDANLSGAYLSDANLRGAYLGGVNLRDANLSGANLSVCTGNRSEIKSIFTFKTYPITYTDKVMQIGCERHELSEWWDFDDARIVKMDGKKALKFWRESKDIIKQIIELFPATESKSEV